MGFPDSGATGSETESLLFCLQAGLGAGVFGYLLGVLRERAKHESKAESQTCKIKTDDRFLFPILSFSRKGLSMFEIDTLCYHSKLRERNAEIKFAFTVLSTVPSYCEDHGNRSIVIAAIVFATTGF